ncbi:MAG TPA: ABC transporter substrate-binding protein [Candidatus Acidoferrales bacterium]
MRRPRSKFAVPVAALLAAAALVMLPGCRTSPTPAEPGTLVFLIESMPTNLDPRIGTDAQSQRLHSLIYSGLLGRDEQMNLTPDLAERWENPDPLTYVFHLRRDVQFHDGRPLTAADVKFTFDSIITGAIRTAKRGTFRVVISVETPDDHTVVFRLSEPFASFLWNVTRAAVGIVPRAENPEHTYSEQPIGSGPFRFVSKRQDEEVVLERNAGYFAADQLTGNARRVRFRIVPDATVRALELQKGSADIALSSLSPDVVPVLAARDDIDVTSQPGSIYAYLALNLEDPILARVEVRQALAYATDRESLVRHLLRGQARIAHSLLPPNHWAYEPDVRQYHHDPARADALLDAAGFPRAADGLRFTLTMKTSTDELSRLIAAVLQDQWRRVGVRLELRPFELATLLADIARGSFQLYTLRWVGANNDPDIFEFVFHSRKMPPEGANRGRYRNARLDALVDAARIESDRARRKQLYSEVQKIVAEDLPYIHLWHMDNVAVHRARVTNVVLPPAGDYDFVANVRIAER